MESKTTEQAAPEAQALYPLEAAELVASIEISEGGRKFKLDHVFRTFTRDDWREYSRLTEVTMTGRAGEDGAEMSSSQDDATERFWRETVVRVDGYRYTDEHFRERMPLKHMRAAIEAATQCYVAEDDESGDDDAGDDDAASGADHLAPSLGPAPGSRSIVIEAGRDGREYPRLVHHFRQPTSSEIKKYRGTQSRETLIRGRRKRRGEWRSVTHAELGYAFNLYDKLIESVEGYEPADPKKMDPVHIDVAIKELMGNV